MAEELAELVGVHPRELASPSHPLSHLTAATRGDGGAVGSFEGDFGKLRIWGDLILRCGRFRGDFGILFAFGGILRCVLLGLGCDRGHAGPWDGLPEPGRPSISNS